MRRILVLLTVLSATTASGQQTQEISIMSFNVENLFDNQHDRGKNDETYLPLAQKKSKQHRAKCMEISVARWRDQCLHWDWNDQIVTRKLRSVAAAIKQVNNGIGPDIIALQEVENEDILEQLREEYLQGLGYRQAVLIEGTDKRGIDVAFLSKLKVSRVNLHKIDFSGMDKKRVADSRGILEATFELPDGGSLTGFAVHFPAPFHPTRMREIAYQHLNELLTEVPRGNPVFAAGDFNTTSEEDKKKRMLHKHVRPHWAVAHDQCAGCKGTSYYPPKNDWSFLDMILWREADGWSVDEVFIANKTDEQVTAKGTPRRFQLPQGAGVSDHWPLVMTISR